MAESKSITNELSIYTEKLRQAYDVIEKSSIVVFEWSIGPGIPVKYVTENISNYGYTTEDFYSGKVDYWAFVYKEDVERTKKEIYEKRASDIKEFKHKYRVICKDGTIRWVEEWILWERDLEGNAIEEKGIIRDITDQVETAEKLRLSEERYRKLFENACALICTFDGCGKFTSINNACADITGYSKSELMKMNILDLLVSSKETEGIITNDLLHIVQDIKNNNIELTIFNKYKKEVVLEGQFIIISDNNPDAEIQAVMHDVTLRKEAEKKIYHLSYHDKLTDLYNRAFFDETLEKLDKAEKFPYSLILGDINGLKSTNDLYGHRTGDKLIQTMAEILRQSCRKSDIIARIGGDEFAIVLPNCSGEEANNICDRIRKLCLSYKDNIIRPDIALGYSTKTDCKKTNDDLILEADKKMYLNKPLIRSILK